MQNQANCLGALLGCDPCHAGKCVLENQQEFQQVFADNPTNGLPGDERLAYSFASLGGDALFAALDPYCLTGNQTVDNLGGNVTSAQLDWLADQVAQTKATHKFLFIHTPYYYVTGQDPDENSTSNQSHTLLWSHLDKNRFDFLACGHQHLFSWKAIDSSIPPQSPNKPTSSSLAKQCRSASQRHLRHRSGHQHQIQSGPQPLACFQPSQNLLFQRGGYQR